MKTTTFALILLLTGLDLWAQTAPTNNIRRLPARLRNGGTNSVAPAALPAMPAFPAPGAPPAFPAAATAPGGNATPDASATAAAGSQPAEEMIPAGNINFQGVDVSQVLEVYAKLVGRTLLRAGLPSASIVLQTQTPLTKSEAIQALQAVLALNGIAVVNIGDKFVKVLPVDQANSAGAEFNTADAANLPDLGTYVTRIVQLKNIKPSEMVPIITPFAKLANSILPIDSNGILVLRDNAENVKRMLQMIDQVDVAVPAEYVSEVIPILYAQAEDIANALNSLGGTGGGSTVSIGGSSTGPGSTSGTRTGPGVNGASTGFGGGGNGFGQNGQAGQNQNRAFGGATTSANGAASGTSFQQRIQSILQRASTGGGQQDQIQVFGQAKIIADQRANSLLVFATQADMTRIKEVVAKLDVLLSQVLIEAVIMDVTLGNTRNLGVSVAQNQTTVNSAKNITTAGGMNNGQPFFNFLNSATTNAFPGNLTSTLPGGAGQSLSYFANIGPSWDVAVQAAEQDSSATIIQRPRIQTSQAKEASFFVGQTVPYITSTYNNGVSGNSSSYSQLSVGVSLDVTPFINPDGLVVMDINQEIDDLGDAVLIDGNPVYKTTKRTLSSEIAVKDRDTIILGGFIRSDKSKSKSGIPFLQDIPLLGILFTSRTDTKDRQELVVLMRPTVLKTPELAAAQVIKEENRLPGVSAAIRDDAEEERRLTEAQLKYEQKKLKAQNKRAQNDPFFVPLPADMTNGAAPTIP